jgi:mannose-1-phosphate guanylyltransferase
MVRAILERVKARSGMGQWPAMYVVIMAGGGGTRLWPLSSPERPKPFLALFEEGTLFQRSVGRVVGPELGLGPGDVTVVAAGRYAALAGAQVPGVAVLEEPDGRNTAAAIALATLAIDRPDDEVMVVLPADHLIVDEARFREVIRTAAAGMAGEGGLARAAFGIDGPPLVTLGVQVDRPATEFGYLIPDVARAATIHGLRAYPLQRFEEKPDRERAEVLLAEPGVAWNAGMFVWQRRAIRDALERFAPDILVTVEAGLVGGRLGEAYEAVRATSIDYAVMEPAARAGLVAMGSMDVGWSDLGSWTALLGAIGADGIGRVVQPGEAAEAGPDDLVVAREGGAGGEGDPPGASGRLVLLDGPRGILGPTPSALLQDARPSRARIEALLERVSRQETTP